jgi:hypothetical protein
MHAPRDMSLADRRHQHGLSIDTVAAGILALLIAVPSPISASLTIGGALGLLLTPVTFPAVWRNTRGRWLLIATLALAPMGWFVAQTSLLKDNGRTFNIQIFLYQAALPVGLLASIVGGYWCISRLGLQRFLLLAFAGLLVAGPFSFSQDNPWKYGLALPMSMLAILIIARNRLLLTLVVTTLAAVSIAASFRSWTAILGVTAALAVFARSRLAKSSASRVASLGLVALAAVPLVAWLVVQASTAGLLGEYLEERTNKQLMVSDGNLLLGGRPEWGAAIALFRENPLGIGIGVTPSSEDYWLAIRSMPLGSQGLQDISNVAKSFLQGQVNFHSTFWTFWAVYGVAGIVFSVLALAYFAHAAALSVAKLQRLNERAAVVLLMLSSAWDILFSPITLAAQLAIALATALHVFDDPDVAPIPTEDSKYETSPAD